jgi:hypothetical protein
VKQFVTIRVSVFVLEFGRHDCNRQFSALFTTRSLSPVLKPAKTNWTVPTKVHPLNARVLYVIFRQMQSFVLLPI